MKHSKMSRLNILKHEHPFYLKNQPFKILPNAQSVIAQTIFFTINATVVLLTHLELKVARSANSKRLRYPDVCPYKSLRKFSRHNSRPVSASPAKRALQNLGKTSDEQHSINNSKSISRRLIPGRQPILPAGRINETHGRKLSPGSGIFRYNETCEHNTKRPSI